MVSVLTLLIFGVSAYRSSSHHASELGRVVELAELAQRVSGLVHEMQKERGMTAGYLGSRGNAFASELPEQHRTTDEARENLDRFVSQISMDQSSDLYEKYTTAKALLQTCLAQREQVLSLQVPAPSAIANYTKHNRAMLDAIATISQASHDKEIARQVASYTFFLRGKELAGIERAVLSNTFAQDKFGPGMFVKFISLMAKQDVYFDEFISLADQDAMDAYSSANSLSCVAEVTAYRKAAIAAEPEGGFERDASKWFALKTQQIDGLKSVEDEISNRLLVHSQKKRDAALRQSRLTSLAVVLAFAFVCAFGYTMHRSIHKSIETLITALRNVAEGDGDLTKRLKESKDEFGEVAHYFNLFAERMRNSMADIKHFASSLSQSATELSSTADQLNSNANQTDMQTTTIAAAAEQVSVSVDGLSSLGNSTAQDAERVAEQIEQMATALNSISSDTERSADSATHVSELVDASKTKTTLLSNAASGIGAVVDVIQDIAEQTNLLALNATIESARAGEAGKGFAVVADEVKQLSQGTHRATEEIRERVRSIQAASEDSLESIVEICHAMSVMDQSSRSVSKAVESQMQMTEQMSESARTMSGFVGTLTTAVMDSASASREIAESIHGVQEVSRETTEAASHTGQSSQQLRELADNLDEVVSGFVV